MAVPKANGPNTPGPNNPDPNNPNPDPNDPNKELTHEQILDKYDLDDDQKIDYDEWMAMPPELKKLYEQDMDYPDDGFYKRKKA